MANRSALILENFIADVVISKMKITKTYYGSVYHGVNRAAIVLRFGKSDCPYWSLPGFVCPYGVYAPRGGLFFSHG